LVRGAGETFNLIVPVRRMRKWATSQDILWALDETLEVPSYDDIVKIPVENKPSEYKTSPTADSKKFPVLLPPESLPTNEN